MKDLTDWRSMLYVPGHRQDFLLKAHQRGADAVIIDLEDGVPSKHKAAARDGLLHSVDRLVDAGTPVAVRINRSWTMAWYDLLSVATARVSAVLVPKLESVGRAQVVDDILEELGVEARKLPLIGLIETTRGIQALPAMLDAVPRIRAIIPGNEDLAADMHIEPEAGLIESVFISAIIAARSRGIRLLGTLGGNTHIGDLDGFRQRVTRSRAWGFDGATCFHPNQIPIVNDVYTPDSEELAHARRIVAAFDASEGGAILVDGRMVDRPVYNRARHLLSQHEDR